MIVPMHKYSFLVFHADYSPFLEKLKDKGVLHIIEKNKEPHPGIQEAYRVVNEASKVIRFLESIVSEEHTTHKLQESGDVLLERIKKLQLDIEKQKQKLNHIHKEIKQVEPWGNFSFESINQLKEEAELELKFFYCPQRKYLSKWEKEYDIFKINEENGYVYFVQFVKKGVEFIDLGVEEVKFTANSLRTLLEIKKEIRDQLHALECELKEMATPSIEVLKRFVLEIKDLISDKSVILNTGSELNGRVKVLEGWVPDTQKGEVEAFLESEGVFYMHEEVNETHTPPVLLKNNRFNRLFETISNLYSLPSYNELDLTPFLAPFYLLFFGFCFSDAGYGLLFLVAASILKPRFKDNSNIFSLVQLLGASTMLFGLLGGTFFGIELYKTQLPIYSSLAEAYGTEANPIGKIIQDIMFKASLGLGLVQILFGMFLKATNLMRQKGIVYSLSTLGWAFLIISSGINYWLVSKGLTSFFNLGYSIIGGLCLIAIFFVNTPGKSLLLNFGTGLWDTYNTLVGGVGDLLSYVRLFALGLASAILGLVFNDLALRLFNPEATVVMQVIGFVLMLLVLIVGHAINIFMSGLGSMVHPLRLTFVEFYKNAGFKGGGVAYKPFKKQLNKS